MNMLSRQDKINIVMNIEKKALISGMARLMSQESTLLHAQAHQQRWAN
jgi:hypothetical protein